MPSDEAYQAVLAELTKLVEAWQRHREVINRAVNQLNHEVMAFSDRLDKDDKARVIRQTEIDGILKRIHVVVVMELLAVIIAVAYLIGRNL